MLGSALSSRLRPRPCFSRPLSLSRSRRPNGSKRARKAKCWPSRSSSSPKCNLRYLRLSRIGKRPISFVATSIRSFLPRHPRHRSAPPPLPQPPLEIPRQPPPSASSPIPSSLHSEMKRWTSIRGRTQTSPTLSLVRHASVRGRGPRRPWPLRSRSLPPLPLASTSPAAQRGPAFDLSPRDAFRLYGRRSPLSQCRSIPSPPRDRGSTFPGHRHIYHCTRRC